MQQQFTASLTMFVFLRGHHLLESYFTTADARIAANDGDFRAGGDGAYSLPPGPLDRYGWD